MRKLYNLSFGAQLLILIALLFIGVAIVTLTSYLLIPRIANMTVNDFATYTNYSNPNYIKAFKTIMPFQTFFFFGFPALLFAFVLYKNIKDYLGLNAPKIKMHFIWAIFAVFSAMFFVALLAQWNKMIPMPKSWIDSETQLAGITKAILNMNSIPSLLFTIFYIGILPGICEELLFRGCLQNIFIQNNPKRFHVWIWITAIVFGIIHGQMQTVLPRIFLGAMLGYFYYYSGSLWVSIIAHVFNNAFQVVMAFFINKNVLPSNIEHDNFVHPIAGISAGILSLVFLFFIYKTKQNYPILHPDSKLELEN